MKERDQLDKEAYACFQEMVSAVTGQEVHWLQFIDALHTTVKVRECSYDEAEMLLHDAYNFANRAFLVGGLTWENLAGLSLAYDSGQTWAIFLRKAHNEEMDKR